VDGSGAAIWGDWEGPRDSGVDSRRTRTAGHLGGAPGGALRLFRSARSTADRAHPAPTLEPANLAAGFPGRVEEYAALLDSYEQRVRSEAPPHVDMQQGVQEKLRALGYDGDQ
jgi:hypothetical protein